MNTDQGVRYNLMGVAARKTNPQYAELNKRLEQYYADRRKTDADYQRDTWDTVRKKVADNRIDTFGRPPSELRRYREFTWTLRMRYATA